MGRNHAIILFPERLKDALEAFILARKAERKQPYTLRVYRLHVNTLIIYLGDVETIDHLTVTHLRDFFVELQEEHNEGGVHSYYRSIKAFLRWYWQEYEVDQANPIERVKIHAAPLTPRPGLSMADFSRLVDCCNGPFKDRDRAIFNCLLDSGCRAGELCRLNVDDVEFITGKVYIWYSKSRRSRVVRFGDKSRRYLRKYLKGKDLREGEPLFVSDAGDRMTTSGLYQMLERRSNDANISAPGLHDFRRRCAAEMRKNGADLRSIQAYLGHSSLAVTERYLALENDEVMENHRLFSPVDHAD